MATTEEVIFKISLGADNAAKQLSRISKASNELKLDRKELNLQLKTNQITQEEYNKLLAENIAESQKLSTERQKETRNLKNAQAVSDDYNGSLVQQRGILRALQTQFDNLSEAERENEEIGGALTEQIDELNEKILNSEKSTGRAQRQVGFYEKALGDAAGGINIFGVNLGQTAQKLNTFRQGLIAQNAATGASSKGLQLFKVALISTGIGAIVVLIGTLVAAFLSTQQGIDTLNRALRPLQITFERAFGAVQDFTKGLADGEITIKDIGDAILENLSNRLEGAIGFVTSLGKALKALAERDLEAFNTELSNAGSNFIKANTGAEDFLGTLSDFGSEVLEVSKRLEDLDKAIRLVEIRNKTLVADLRAQAEAQRTLAQNVNLTTEERVAAANKAIGLIDQVSKAEQELIDLQIEQLELRQAQSDTTDAELLELANLRAQRDEIERNRISQQREVNNQLNSLLKANTDAERNALQQLEQLRRDNANAQITNERTKQKKLLELQLQSQLDSVELLKATEETKNAIRLELENQYQIALQALRDKYRESDNEKEEQKIQAEITRGQNRLIALRELDVLEAENLQERNDALLALEQQRQANELANFTGTEEERLLLLAQFNEREIELTNQLRNAKIQANLAVAQSFGDLFTNLAGLAKDNAGLQKAATLFQLGLDTAKAISGAVAQAQSVPFPANIAAVATGVSTVVANIARARNALKNTPKFEKGGIAKGASHAQGGIPFHVGGQLMEMEGGELIVNKGIWSRPDFVNAISEMNHATGGVRFGKGGVTKFQDGGTVNAIRNNVPSFKDLPPIVVTVEDINAGQQSRAKVVSRANL